MKRLVVFIHGKQEGDSKFGRHFPDLLQSDTQISERYNVLSYNYHVGIFRYLLVEKDSILQALTQRLRKKLMRVYKGGEGIAFVSHGIGGLIARNYIVEDIINKRAGDIDRLLMFAVPNRPSDLSRIYDSLSWNNYLDKNISRNTDAIEKLNKSWEDNKVKTKVAVKYILGEQDNRIDKDGAIRQWGPGYFTPIAKKDHWEVFKPTNHDDSEFLITKQFLFAEAPVEKKYPENLLAIAEILNWELDDAERESAIHDIVYIADLLNQLSWRSRQLFCAIIQKAQQVSYDEMIVYRSEISKTLNFTNQDLEAELLILKKNRLIDFETTDLYKIALKSPNDKWFIWDQLKGYCQKSGVSLRRLIVDLDFDLLDLKTI